MRTKSALLSFAIGLFTAGSAFAATPGYLEDFNSGIGGWGGGSEAYELLLGGVDGAADSFLRVGNDTFAGQLGTRNAGPDYTGDLIADGVTGFSFWLKDVGTDDDVQIHVGVGSSFLNFWTYDIGFEPLEDQWTQFSVDITSSVGWTQILGSGTFDDAIASSDRLLFRHDLAPFSQNPDTIQGDFGIDNIRVVPEPMTGLALLVGGRLRFAVGGSCHASIHSKQPRGRSDSSDPFSIGVRDERRARHS